LILDKLKIKKMAGVYQWVNVKDGQTYVGSSTNLGLRFTQYFNKNNLVRNKMHINSAL
jgi:excinuclease UvrABC nuclease subunit